jgi:hypothetical protein
MRKLNEFVKPETEEDKKGKVVEVTCGCLALPLQLEDFLLQVSLVLKGII